MTILLVGDIGGTNSRLKLIEINEGALQEICYNSYLSQNYISIIAIIDEFLKGKVVPKLAVIGIVGVTHGDTFDSSYLPNWSGTTTTEIELIFGIQRVKFLNDFEVAGYGVLELGEEDVIPLQPNVPVQQEFPKVLIGPGTGLGECAIFPLGERNFKVFSSEGSQCDFGPKNELEWRYAKYIMSLVEQEGSPYSSLMPIQQITYDLALSGTILPHIYYFFKSEFPELVEPEFDQLYENSVAERPKLLMEFGLAGRNELCKLSAELFLRILGYECGNLVAKIICKGGLYIIGGVVQKNAKLIADNPALLEGFYSKPRQMVRILKQTPVFIVTFNDVGLLGALVYAKKLISELN